eukprot:5935188-Pyramimonas_sp.AAC.1
MCESLGRGDVGRWVSARHAGVLCRVPLARRWSGSPHAALLCTTVASARTPRSMGSDTNDCVLKSA